MSENSGFTSCLVDIADAVRSGDVTRAKRYAGRLLGELDRHTADVVADCVDTVERFPDRAEVHLRAKWKAAATDTDRTVIAAFGTALVQRGPRPTTTPARRPVRDTAPRDKHTGISPEARRTPTPADRARLRAQDRRDAVTADYADRAGVDDQPPPDTVYASGLDFDRAAVPALRGTPCVRCWLERPPADFRSASDDGLCGECREKGRPGIPDLPAGHTRADAVQARCAYLAANYPNARGLLAQWWKTYATPADRTVIADWVHHHPLPATAKPATPPAPSPATEPDTPTPAADQQTTDKQAATPEDCARCGDPLDTTDTDLCPDCREVDRMVTAD